MAPFHLSATLASYNHSIIMAFGGRHFSPSDPAPSQLLSNSCFDAGSFVGHVTMVMSAVTRFAANTVFREKGCNTAVRSETLT
jgi:hypothetical protein